MWPFTVADLRNRITHDQLGWARQKVLGETGGALSALVGYVNFTRSTFCVVHVSKRYQIWDRYCNTGVFVR